MPRLNVAVIGCGWWGAQHARVLREIEEARLVAVADVDESRARQVGARYGVDWYVDSDRLLSRGDVEAVTICTPSSTHVEVALKAIEAGKHVLVEKPLASSASEAYEILRAARRRGVRLTVGHIERFNPGVRRVKRLLEEGRVGEVVLISSRRVSMWPVRVGDVGVVKDLAIHDIDVMRYLLGKDPLEVYAVAGSLRHSYEDYAHIVLRFEPREVGFIESNWLTPHKVRKLVVTCTDGLITLDYITQKVTIEDPSGIYAPSYTWQEPLKIELESFVKAILEDRPFEVDGVDGYKALCIAEAALRSAAEGRVVRVEC